MVILLQHDNKELQMVNHSQNNKMEQTLSDSVTKSPFHIVMGKGIYSAKPLKSF